MPIQRRIAGRVERRRFAALATATVVMLALLPAVEMPHHTTEVTGADPRNGWRPASEGGSAAATVAAATKPVVFSPDGVPRRDAPPKAVATKPATRVKELPAQRTANARVYQLSDGRLQQEISADPLHYQTSGGRWQPIQTAITPSNEPGYAYANPTNAVRAAFGTDADRLVRLRTAAGTVTFAAPQARRLTPKVSGDRITYPDAFGAGIDLSYVTAAGMTKEEIILTARPQQTGDLTFTFTAALDGLRAEEGDQGSIVFRPAAGGPVALVMPAPFMTDAAGDTGSPYGKAWSDQVTQRLSGHDDGDGGRVTITATAHGEWLAAAGRRYPVVIDPTVKLAPTPTDSEDTMVLSEPGAADANYDSSWRLSVGTTASGVARSLLRFPLTGIPANTAIDSAQLQVYQDQWHTTKANAVTVAAHRSTGAWTETAATWNTTSGFVGEIGTNTEEVDDGDFWQHAVNGSWPYATAADKSFAIGGDYAYNKNATPGETYTWYPIVTEPGVYQVWVHYVSGPDRATNVPYTVNFSGGSQTYTVNQSAATAGGVWKLLGSHQFATGTAGTVVLGDVADASKVVVADAVKVVKEATAVRPAGENSGWHSFSVRSIVQTWLNGGANNGFVLKAANEGVANQGGPRYEGSIYAYNGETAIYPRLIVTYARPGVTLNPPTTIHATGAELSWSAYTDPCGFCADDDIVEYQVHRSVFQTFTPSAATLVAPVPAGTTSYTDTTAVPTAVDDPDPFGRAFYYMVAVKTADGGLTVAPTQIVRLPKAGRVTKIIQSGVVDTTLSAQTKDTNLDVFDGQPWIVAGANDPTYGTTRAALKFPLTGIPTSARVVGAEIKLWNTWLYGDDGGGPGRWHVRGLSRDFVENQATWNKASSTTAWTTPGGDAAATAYGSATGFTNDPKRQNFDVKALAQGWVSTPSSNKGVLIQAADEAGRVARAVFLSSEAAEPELRPQLAITYLDVTPESTYFIPDTPAAVTAGLTGTVAATVTNTTTQTLAKADWVLSYTWTRPDGTAVAATQDQTALPADLAPQQAAMLNAKVTAPALAAAEGNRRVDHVLSWELYNKTTGQWMSQVSTAGALKQTLAVQDATSDQVGLESFYAYAGRNTGAGGAVMTNLHAGNAVWTYNAFANPSRGLSTFVRLAYNSQDTSDSVAGFGWSAQAASVMRLGTPLDPHPNPQGREVALTDGDGTTHTFAMVDDRGTPAPTDDLYAHPAGVHLFLEHLVDCKPQDEYAQAWRMTRPDRTQFYFDCAGYHTSTVDKNGNVMTFVYEARRSNNQPTKFLKYIVDAAGRRTLTVTYWAKGDTYDQINDTTWTKTTGLTNLTNPFIIDHVRSITDISGRSLLFTYTDKGLLGELLDDPADAVPAKRFAFQYDMTQGNKNVKLVKITDPRGNATGLAYYSATEPMFTWAAKTITDRLGGVTQVAYSDPDGQTGQEVQTVVTDAELRSTTYRTDGRGRPTQATDAKNQVIKMQWDTDNNVTRLEEPGGPVRTWAYDVQTGYPTEVKDAEAVANGYPGTTLTYQKGLGGNIADLIAKRSPEGRTWTFGYTAEGDLATVTDPAGAATTTAGDYTTTYTYDTWGQLLSVKDANGNTTAYGDHHPTGRPRRVTDALSKVSTIAFDDRGNVTELVDALGKKTTQTYDGFGRQLQLTVPIDQGAGQFAVTPAPIYDANDNVVRSTAANGAVTDAGFDACDRVTFVLAPKDAAGDPERRTTYTYDKVDNLRTETQPKGNLTTTAGDFVTTYAYDEVHRLTSVTNALGRRLEYQYDAAGNVAKILDPRKVATPDTGDFTTAFWYDRNHRERVAFDALGKAAITEYDRDGLVKAAIDKAGARTDYTLDARGKPVEVKAPHVDNAGTITYRITRQEYDPVGNRTKVITPRGVATAAAGDFTHQTVYDAMNRVKERLTPYDPADARYNQPDKTVYSYDDAGRITRISAPPSSGETVRNDTTYTYTDNGWTKTSTDPWEIVTAYAYNPIGQQVATVTSAAGGSTSRWRVSDYHPDGKLKLRADNGVPVGNQVVQVDNSDFNNVTAIGVWATATSGTGYQGRDYRTHAAGAGTDAVEWALNVPQDGAYDVYVRYPSVTGAATAAPYKITHAAGTTDKPVNQTQNPGGWVNVGKYLFAGGAPAKITLGQTTTGIAVADAVKLVRDNSGDTDNESVNFTYAYDPNGNLTRITDASPHRTVDSYDVAYTGLNEVGRVDEIRGGSTQDFTSFTYTVNSLVETVATGSSHAKYEYDVRDLIAKVTSGTSATDPGPQVTTYTYTDKGERLREVKGNGNTVDFTYYLDGLLRTQVEKKAGGALVADHGLTYDLNGNRVGDAARKMNADNHGALIDASALYAYDPRDRIAAIYKAGGETETYTHDANDNVIRQTVKNVTTDFNYDRNRLLTAVSGGVKASYNYDPYGRLDTVTMAGQVTERKIYDGFDHVKEERITSGGVTRATRFTYDPLDRTASKTTDAGTAQQKTTDFAYLGLSNQVLGEEVAGELTKSYQYSPWGERLSQVTHDGTQDQTSFYGYNPHTDVETLTDEAGDTRATYGYSAYGKNDEAQFSGIDKPVAGDPAKEPYNPYRFNAKRWDSGSGDYDMGFRDYRPDLGRFLTRDMYNGSLADLNLTANPFTGNRYAFGGGNPVSRVELDGHIPDDCARGTLNCYTDRDGTWNVRPRATPGDGPVITSTDGPSLTQDEIDELTQQADDIARDIDHWLSVGGLGACGEGSAATGLAGAAGLCGVWDGQDFTLLGFYGVGSGTPYAGLGAGPLLSNAESVDKIYGKSWCVGGGAGLGWSVSVEVCISYTDDWESPTGYWSATVVGGPGAGADLHITAVTTHEIAAWTPPGWLMHPFGEEYMECACPAPDGGYSEEDLYPYGSDEVV
ncbi:MAG: DNRLRE domain-containing protein [Hamadaea sp.]|nr:DNRLRE domain-containing protein [Hamadaea sp.]